MTYGLANAANRSRSQFYLGIGLAHVIVLGSWTSGFAWAGADPEQSVASDAAVRKKWEYLLSGMISERNRLKSGLYRAYGLTIREGPPAGHREDPLSVVCAFDFSAERLRFDRTEVVVKRAAAPGSAEAFGPERPPPGIGVLKDMVELTRFYRTPTLSALYAGGTHRVAVRRSEDIPSHSWQVPFDVRALGLYYEIDFSRGSGWEKIRDAFANPKYPPDEIDEDVDGIHRIVWTFNRHHRRTLWIDETHGFTPVKMMLQGHGVQAGPNWAEPKNLNEVTWALHGDVWVPTTFRFTQRKILTERGKSIGDRVLTYALSFEWETANQTVSDRWFSYEDFEVLPGTVVVDRRGTTPKRLATLGLPEVPAQPTARQLFVWRTIAIVTAVCLFAIFVTLCVYRYRRTRGLNRQL